MRQKETCALVSQRLFARLCQVIPAKSREEEIMRGWLVYGAAALGVVIYGAATQVDRDQSGTIVGEGNIDAFQIRVGDCFNDPSSLSDQVHDLPGVPCTEPHDNEAYAVFDLSLDNYPEGDAIADLAYESCRDRFESFVGRDYDSSALDIFSIYPSFESWGQDDREVICAVFDVDENKLVGSARGSAL